MLVQKFAYDHRQVRDRIRRLDQKNLKQSVVQVYDIRIHLQNASDGRGVAEGGKNIPALHYFSFRRFHPHLKRLDLRQIAYACHQVRKTPENVFCLLSGLIACGSEYAAGRDIGVITPVETAYIKFLLRAAHDISGCLQNVCGKSQTVRQIIRAACRNVSDRHIDLLMRDPVDHFVQRTVTACTYDEIAFFSVFSDQSSSVSAFHRQADSTFKTGFLKDLQDLCEKTIGAFLTRFRIQNEKQFFLHKITLFDKSAAGGCRSLF